VRTLAFIAASVAVMAGSAVAEQVDTYDKFGTYQIIMDLSNNKDTLSKPTAGMILLDECKSESFIVDTGSMLSTIVNGHQPYNLEESWDQLVTYQDGRQEYQATTIVPSVRIGHHVLHDVKFAVMEHGLQCIGMNILSQLEPWSLDSKNKKLNLP
jgi:hypothetical protein